MYLSNRPPNLTHNCQLATIGQGNKNSSWKYVYSHIFFPSNIHIPKVQSITHLTWGGGWHRFYPPLWKHRSHHGVIMGCIFPPTSVGRPRSSFCSVNWRKWNPTIQCRSVIHFFFGPWFIGSPVVGRLYRWCFCFCWGCLSTTKHWHADSPNTQGFTAGLKIRSWLYYPPGN